MKYCKFCDDDYECDSNHWYRNRKTGYLVCRKKSKEKATQWQIDNRKKQNETAKASYIRNRESRTQYMRERRYGISIENFQSLLEQQDGKCAICSTSDWGGRGNSPHVDHDHKNKTIRGLLCSKCNFGIGFFDEDENKLQGAIKYLRMWKVVL